MKTLLKLGNITVGNVSVSDITIEQEYTAKDVVDLAFNGKNFVKELIKELPEVMDDLYVAFNKFNELDKKAEEEHGWTVTEVTHSHVTDDQMKMECEMARLEVQIGHYVHNGVGNSMDLTHEIQRLQAICNSDYINDRIDLDSFTVRTAKLEQLRQMLRTTKAVG